MDDDDSAVVKVKVLLERLVGNAARQVLVTSRFSSEGINNDASMCRINSCYGGCSFNMPVQCGAIYAAAAAVARPPVGVNEAETAAKNTGNRPVKIGRTSTAWSAAEESSSIAVSLWAKSAAVTSSIISSVVLSISPSSLWLILLAVKC